jgi:hypothetical protein
VLARVLKESVDRGYQEFERSSAQSRSSASRGILTRNAAAPGESMPTNNIISKHSSTFRRFSSAASVYLDTGFDLDTYLRGPQHSASGYVNFFRSLFSGNADKNVFVDLLFPYLSDRMFTSTSDQTEKILTADIQTSIFCRSINSHIRGEVSNMLSFMSSWRGANSLDAEMDGHESSNSSIGVVLQVFSAVAVVLDLAVSQTSELEIHNGPSSHDLVDSVGKLVAVLERRYFLWLDTLPSSLRHLMEIHTFGGHGQHSTWSTVARLLVDWKNCDHTSGLVLFSRVYLFCTRNFNASSLKSTLSANDARRLLMLIEKKVSHSYFVLFPGL